MRSTEKSRNWHVCSACNKYSRITLIQISAADDVNSAQTRNSMFTGTYNPTNKHLRGWSGCLSVNK